MTVVVTGASGHIGGNLVRTLLEQGRKVRAVIHKDTRALEDLDVERVTANVFDPASLRHAFSGAETVYHLAARISITGEDDQDVIRTNVGGVRNVLDACVATKIKRLVHFSSIHAYSSAPMLAPVDEGRHLALEPFNHAYDRSKAKGQQLVMQAAREGLSAVIVNPTGVIGPNDFRPSAMGQALLDILNRRLVALVDGGFNWVDVRDVVRGAMSAEVKGREGHSYILGGHWASVREIGKMVHESTGIKPPKFTSPLWLAQMFVPFAMEYARVTSSLPLYTYASLDALRANRNISCDKAKHELDYTARPITDTIRNTCHWYKKAGMVR